MTSLFPIAAPFPDSAPRARAVAVAVDRAAFFLLSSFVLVLPWGTEVPVLGGQPVQTLIRLSACCAALLRAAATGHIRRPSPLHWPMAAFAGWAALSLLWTSDTETTLSRTISYFLLLLTVWVIWEVGGSPSRLHRLLQLYLAGSVAASLLTIRNFLLGRSAAQISLEMGRSTWDTNRYTIAGFNVNDLGLALALTLPIACYLLAASGKPRWAPLYYLHLVAASTAILLTGSRGAMLAALVGLSMLPLTIARSRGWRRALALAASGSAILFALYVIPPSTWTRTFSMESELTQGDLTHRTLLWRAGLDAFRDHAIAGIGAGAYGVAVSDIADFAYLTGNASNAVAHSTFISVLVELGVVGALLWLVLLAGLFVSALRMPFLERWFWVTVLLTWLVGVSSLTWEYRKETWLYFGLLSAHSYAARRGAVPGWDRRRGSGRSRL